MKILIHLDSILCLTGIDIKEIIPIDKKQFFTSTDLPQHMTG